MGAGHRIKDKAALGLCQAGGCRDHQENLPTPNGVFGGHYLGWGLRFTKRDGKKGAGSWLCQQLVTFTQAGLFFPIFSRTGDLWRELDLSVIASSWIQSRRSGLQLELFHAWVFLRCSLWFPWWLMRIELPPLFFQRAPTWISFLSSVPKALGKPTLLAR